jgi:hypothetical protein
MSDRPDLSSFHPPFPAVERHPVLSDEDEELMRLV